MTLQSRQRCGGLVPIGTLPATLACFLDADPRDLVGQSINSLDDVPLIDCDHVAFVTIPDAEHRDRRRFRFALFDAGYFKVRTNGRAGGHLSSLYVRSDLVTNTGIIDIDDKHVVSMPSLGHAGRFGNQLFHYLFLTLYGIRHDCQIASSRWSGEDIFGLQPRRLARRLPLLVPTDDNFDPLIYWNMEHPPRDVEITGYFQCLPRSFRKHKQFLRRLFAPVQPIDAPISLWLEGARGTGRIVAVHVRRGDYLPYDPRRTNIFSQVPLAWYLSWLKEHFAQNPEDILYVATDDPSVLSEFEGFPMLTARQLPPKQVDRDMVDFFTLARADILLVVNSSWSRMAALLNHRIQNTYIVDFARRGFKKYEPWDDLEFWPQFGYPTDSLVHMTPDELRSNVVEMWTYEGHLQFWLKRPIRWIWTACWHRFWASSALLSLCDLAPLPLIRTFVRTKHYRAQRFIGFYGANWRRMNDSAHRKRHEEVG